MIMQKDQVHSALTLLLEAHDELARSKADLDRNLDDDNAGRFIQAIDSAQEEIRELIESLESYSTPREELID